MVADLTHDEAIDRARAIEVESYDIFLDLTAEPVLSRTEIRFRWLRPRASTFAELRTQGVRAVALDGVSLPHPDDEAARAARRAQRPGSRSYADQVRRRIAAGAEPSDNVLRLAVAEQAVIMRRRLAARCAV